MFGLGTGEIVLIGFVILLFIGPKKIPQLARGFGESIRGFKTALQGKDETEKEKL